MSAPTRPSRHVRGGPPDGIRRARFASRPGQGNVAPVDTHPAGTTR